MLMRLGVLTDRAEQHPKIILYTSLIAPVSCLSEVVTGCGILNQRTVYVIAPMFGCTKIFKYSAKLIVKPPLDVVI